MYGTITQYMGTAYTGHGIAHKYRYIDCQRRKTIFLKCSSYKCHYPILLNETAAHYLKRGFDVDRFNNPVQPDNTDAIFVKDLSLLIIQASHPVALEPSRYRRQTSCYQFL